MRHFRTLAAGVLLLGLLAGVTGLGVSLIGGEARGPARLTLDPGTTVPVYDPDLVPQAQFAAAAMDYILSPASDAAPDCIAEVLAKERRSCQCVPPPDESIENEESARSQLKMIGNLAGARIEGVTFKDTPLSKADFRCSSIGSPTAPVTFERVDLTGADFSCTTLRNVTFRDSSLFGSFMPRAVLWNVTITGSESDTKSLVANLSMVCSRVLGLEVTQTQFHDLAFDWRGAVLQDVTIESSDATEDLIGFATILGGGNIISRLAQSADRLDPEFGSSLLVDGMRADALNGDGLELSLPVQKFEAATAPLALLAEALRDNAHFSDAERVEIRIERLRDLWLSGRASQAWKDSDYSSAAMSYALLLLREANYRIFRYGRSETRPLAWALLLFLFTALLLNISWALNGDRSAWSRFKRQSGHGYFLDAARLDWPGRVFASLQIALRAVLSVPEFLDEKIIKIVDRMSPRPWRPDTHPARIFYYVCGSLSVVLISRSLYSAFFG